MLTFVDYVTNELKQGKYVLGIYLDIKKAFDSVNHEILFQKLHKYGIRGNSLRLIKSYLSNRCQCVKLVDSKGNRIISNHKQITCGVPQGSVLGPLLFLLYVNDLKNASTILRTITFADDTNIFLSHIHLNDLCNIANTELEKVLQWFHCNRLCLNVLKTSYQLYTKKTEDAVVQQIQINNQPIKRERVVKFLGILVDEDLSFKEQIGYVCKQVFVCAPTHK